MHHEAREDLIEGCDSREDEQGNDGHEEDRLERSLLMGVHGWFHWRLVGSEYLNRDGSTL